MLEPVRHILDTKKIVLASSSPRRFDILKNLGLSFEVISSTYEEDLDPLQYSNPADFVVDTARNKVLEVASRPNMTADIIIGADTAVTLEGHIYGKPHDEQYAFDMLSRLSGRWHVNYTGVVLKTPHKMIQFSEKVNVLFGDLSPQIIHGYIKTGEPMDKAGGYGVQGFGGSLISSFDGDYFTAVGLPVHSLTKHLSEIACAWKA